MNALGAQDAASRKEKIALSSIAASAGIALAKLMAGLISGSLALLSEAGHAAVDTAATVMTYFAVRAANKPADEDHHYGHGKYESLAALAEMVLLFVLATVVVIQSIARLRSGGGEFEPTVLAFGVLIVSILVDLNRVRSLRTVAKETGSQALAADAMHFASDLIGSVLVLIGLGSALFGFHYGDALAAIGVAAFISVAGWRLGRQTINTLLDAAPGGLAARVQTRVLEVPGVVAIEGLRLRPGGAHVFGEMTIAVSRLLPQSSVSVIKKNVIAAVSAVHPEVALNVTAVPRVLDDETTLECVHATAADLRMPIHHVTVQETKEGLSIGLDLEVEGATSIKDAHVKATELEDAIRFELGPKTEVETHIEPLFVRHLDGKDVPEEVRRRAEETLCKLASGVPEMGAIHDVRVHKTPSGLVINYHCYFKPDTSVAAAHKALDALERAMSGEIPDIGRIIGHAEPEEC